MSTTLPTSQVLIVYYSRFGVLKDLAEAIAEGVLKEPQVDVHFLRVEDEPLDAPRPGEDAQAIAERRAPVMNRLAGADALIVGAPSYFGSMASPVKRLFEDCLTADNPPQHDRSRPWYGHRFRDKVGAAFTASATPHGGNEQGLQSILTLMMHLGMVVITPGQSEPILANPAAPYGATVVSGPEGSRLAAVPELTEARALGLRVARMTTWLHTGRREWEKHHAAEATGVTRSV